MAVHARGTGPLLAVVAAVSLVAGCDAIEAGGDVSSDAGAPALDSGAVSPFKNTDGTGPGLAPLTSAADLDKARQLMATLTVKSRGPRTGYERDKFGYAWMDTAEGVALAHNGCDTRNDLLKRDGQDLRFRSGSTCVVVSMTLHDPYTGKDIAWKKEKATAVQIDHVVPLSYSWQMGAAHWPENKRKQLANDPLNLLPVDGPSNSRKSDSGPASWLPPNEQIHCAYAVRFTQVALKYQLAVTSADKEAMRRQCTA